MFSSTIKPYKFVNPSSISSGGGGATIIAAGKNITSGITSQVKSSRVTLLAINRIGLAMESTGKVQKQIRDIITYENTYLTKSADLIKKRAGYIRDQKSEEKSESFGKKEQDGVSKEVIKKEKKELGWLEKIFGPFAGIISFVGQFIVTQTILKWMSDPKNGEKLVVFVKSITTVLKWAVNIAMKSTDAVLTGFAKVFGSSDKKGLDRFGEVLGGLGSLLIGIAGFKALGYLLNPFSLVNDIVGLVELLNGKAGKPTPGADAPVPGGGPKQLGKAATKVGQNYGNDAGRFYDDLIKRGKTPAQALKAVKGKFSKVPPPPKGFLDKMKKGLSTRFDDLKFMAKKGINSAQKLGGKALTAGKFALEEGKKLGVGVLEEGKKLAGGAGKWLKATGQQMEKMKALVSDPKALMAYVNDLIATKVRPAINKNPIAKTVIDLVKNPKEIPKAVGNLVKTASKSKEALTLIKYLKTVKDTVKVSGIDKIIGILTGLIDYGLLGTPMVNAFLGAIGGLLGYTGGFALGAPFGGITGFFTGAAGGFAGEFIGRELAKLIGKGPLGKIKDPIMRDGRMLADPELAEGGIVDKPTRAIIGEDGPEAIIPLDQIGDIGGTAGTLIGATESALSRMGAAGEIARTLIGGDLKSAAEMFGSSSSGGVGGDSLGKSVNKGQIKSLMGLDQGEDISEYIGDGTVSISDKKNSGNKATTLRGQLANILSALIWVSKKNLSGGGSGGGAGAAPGAGGESGGDVDASGIEGVTGSAVDKGVPIAKKFASIFGLTNEAAAGMAGNFAYESAGFIPGIREGGPFGSNSKPWPKGTVDRGYGWAQWTNSVPGDRYDKFIESYGGDYNKIPTNADNFKFVVKEINGSAEKLPAKFKKMNDAAAAAVWFRTNWERPSIPHDAERIGYAKGILAKMAKGGLLKFDGGGEYNPDGSPKDLRIKKRLERDGKMPLMAGGGILAKLGDGTKLVEAAGGKCTTGVLLTMEANRVPNPAGTGDDGNNPRGLMVQAIKSYGWGSLPYGKPINLNSPYGKVGANMMNYDEWKKNVKAGNIPSGALVFSTKNSNWNSNGPSGGHDSAIAKKGGARLWSGHWQTEVGGVGSVYGTGTQAIVALTPGGANVKYDPTRAGASADGGKSTDAGSTTKSEEEEKEVNPFEALEKAVAALRGTLGYAAPAETPAEKLKPNEAPKKGPAPKTKPKPTATGSTPAAVSSGSQMSNASRNVATMKEAADSLRGAGQIIPLPINNPVSIPSSSGTQVSYPRSPITYGI